MTSVLRYKQNRKLIQFNSSTVVFKMAATDLEDAAELDRERKLYLKSIARMVILVQLPELKIPGTSISNWEVMEKLKGAICPNVFSYLKVTKTTMEYLHFEAEAESKDLLTKFIDKLDAKAIKLSGFPEPFKVKAGKAKVLFPKKHDWVAFFRDSINTDESKPGERPDTMHITGLPIKWFSPPGKVNNGKPCEQIVRRIFQTFGPLREIDIPILDPYRSRMNLLHTADEQVFKTFSFGTDLYFEVFIQFKNYKGFEQAMEFFKEKKLVHVLEDDKIAAVNISVDFDKTAFLSERNIEKRSMQRRRLIQCDMEQERIALKIKKEEERQREIERLEEMRREEERQRQIEKEKKQRELEIRIKEQKQKLHKIKKMIVHHEKRRQAKINERKRRDITTQRKDQGGNLVSVILKTIAAKKKIEQQEEIRRAKELKILRKLEAKKLRKEEQKRMKLKAEDEIKEKLENQEKNLRLKLLNNLKEIKESKQEMQREFLREELANKKSRLDSVVCKNVTDL